MVENIDGISGDIGTGITAHNLDIEAHDDLIVSKINLHNLNIDTHTDIRQGVTDSISGHNTNSNAHEDIRTNIVSSLQEAKEYTDIKAGGGGGSRGSPPVIEKTYDELKTMKNAGTLVSGQKYRFYYQTKYVQPYTNVNKTVGGEKLILTAISRNNFATICNSELYPEDIIYYDFDMNIYSGNSRPGYIIRRIDPVKNIDVVGDWRHMLWARYRVSDTVFWEKGVDGSWGDPSTPGQDVAYINRETTSAYNIISTLTDWSIYKKQGKLYYGVANVLDSNPSTSNDDNYSMFFDTRILNTNGAIAIKKEQELFMPSSGIPNNNVHSLGKTFELKMTDIYDEFLTFPNITNIKNVFINGDIEHNNIIKSATNFTVLIKAKDNTFFRVVDTIANTLIQNYIFGVSEGCFFNNLETCKFVSIANTNFSAAKIVNIIIADARKSSFLNDMGYCVFTKLDHCAFINSSYYQYIWPSATIEQGRNIFKTKGGLAYCNFFGRFGLNTFCGDSSFSGCDFLHKFSDNKCVDKSFSNIRFYELKNKNISNLTMEAGSGFVSVAANSAGKYFYQPSTLSGWVEIP